MKALTHGIKDLDSVLPLGLFGLSSSRGRFMGCQLQLRCLLLFVFKGKEADFSLPESQNDPWGVNKHLHCTAACPTGVRATCPGQSLIYS